MCRIKVNDCHVSCSTLFSAFLTLLLSLCVLFLSGGASVTLTLGLVSWCNTVTDQNTRAYRYTSLLKLSQFITLFKSSPGEIFSS